VDLLIVELTKVILGFIMFEADVKTNVCRRFDKPEDRTQRAQTQS